jgi:hypothetical protein
VLLNAGVNLVAFEGQITPVEAATAGLQGDLLAVYAWHADTQSWTAYFPGAPAYASDLGQLTRGAAYYLIMRSGTTWQY